MKAKLLWLVCMFSLSQSVLAEKPPWAGGGNKGKAEEQRHEQRNGGTSFRFDVDTRRIILQYYGQQAQAGHCPPGLAKKNNGCMPPGQAKKWAMGKPLPGDLKYYDLPRDLMRRLPPPPANHRYVQIAGDILLIAIGTSIVIDAVQDILR